MESTLYEALTSGDIDRLKQIALETDHVLLQVTPLKNTILHVAVQFRKTTCVELICKRYPSLLCQPNSKGDTPLHIAVRLGSTDIVTFLISFAQTHTEDIEKGGIDGLEEGFSATVQQLVRKTNMENDTALHLAVQYRRLDIVKLLTEADPEFEYLPNNEGVTPLYLAVESGLYDFVVQILEKCPSSALGGPRRRTALHAAVLSLNTDLVKVLLEKTPSTIVKEADEYGCSALHYAAFFGNDIVEVVELLLEADSSVAYMLDKDGMSALHYAASTRIEGSSVEIVKVVIDRCRDCWELVDNNGKNFLHVAVENENVDVIKYVVENSDMGENLINEKNNDGNTPFHLVIKSGNHECLKILGGDSRVNKWVMNKDNFTPFSLIMDTMRTSAVGKVRAIKFLIKALQSVGMNTTELFNRRKQCIKEEIDESFMFHPKTDDTEKEKKEIEAIEKTSQTHMLVATLIATVTFAAGFTLPGGYNSDGPNKGMATLAKKPAFMAFLVFNSIAMLLSTSAVFAYFCLKLVRVEDKKTMDRVQLITFVCTFFAIIAMMVAFVMGTYTVLSHLPGVAIPLTVFGCSFFIFFGFLIRKLVKWMIN